MNKELQDLAWRCLPREFREEVKNVTQRYSYRALALFGKERQLANKFYDDFINLFGRHNLTSDAEGEEILTVPRQDIVELFQEVQKTISQCKGTALAVQSVGIKDVLWSFFGSKCLPDNVDSSEPNVDSLPQNPTENCDNKSHISADCNKPAEPKFKIGDKVKDISSPHDGGIYKVDDIKKSSNGFIYHIQGLIGKSNVKESDLEPYTEPTAKNPKESPKAFASDEPTATGSDDFDRIVNDGFRGHNRLHIATQITASIYSNDKAASQFNSIEALVRKALDIADTLIAEVEKK